MRYLLVTALVVGLPVALLIEVLDGNLDSGSVFAETIMMVCQKPLGEFTDITHWKYESPLIGKAKVFKRKDREWVEWPGATVGERSAVLKEASDYVADKDYPESNVKKGDEYREHARSVYDFASIKNTRTGYFTKIDGSPLVPEKEAHDRAKPEFKEEWSCGRVDESWEDRAKR